MIHPGVFTFKPYCGLSFGLPTSVPFMAHRRLAGLGDRRLAVGTVAGISGGVKSFLQVGL